MGKFAGFDVSLGRFFPRCVRKRLLLDQKGVLVGFSRRFDSVGFHSSIDRILTDSKLFRGGGDISF